MNCKPGDLAFVVSDDFPENIGRVVRVIRAAPGWTRPDAPAWDIEVHGKPPIGYYQEGGYGPCSHPRAYDSDLRPIRDPGDDARDESLAYLPPVPSKQGETA